MSPMPCAAGLINIGQGVEDWVQSAAILGGAIVAYLKYGRGRPFLSRAELRIDATRVQLKDRRAIRVDVEFRNVGATRTDLKSRKVCVCGMTAGSPEAGAAEWTEPLTTVPIFADDEWIESGETIREEVLISVPEADKDGSYIAYLVTCNVEECCQRSWFHVSGVRPLRPPKSTFLYDQRVVPAADG